MRCFPLLLLSLLAVSLRAETNWPQLRGPLGNGHSDAKGLPVEFSETQRLKWKTPIHGKAWASPVIWGNQIWLSNANEAGTELGVVCVDKETGRILKDEILFRVADPQYCHKFNSYGSPTPVIEEGRLYVSYGSPALACVDTNTGKVIWERRDFPCYHYRGPGSSPIVWENLVIQHYDGSDFQYVVAVDKATGKTVWKTDRSIDFKDLGADGKPVAQGDGRKGFSTPQIYEQDGMPVLLSSGAKAHYGYDPRTGKELWRFEERGAHSAATRPVIGHGIAFIPTGFAKGDLLAIKLGGAGVLAEKDLAWRLKRGTPQKPSVTLVGDLLFLVNDGGIASCLDAKTGEQIWTERLGGNFSSSPLYADGKLWAANEEGKVFVFAAEREFKKLAENKLDDGFMASPAVSGNSLFLRSKTALYRFD